MERLDAHYISMHQDNQGPNDGPVTVIVTRKAKKERIREFEEWMDGISHEAMKFDGHMGANIIRPSDPSNPEYVIIFRFDNYENLRKWEGSEVRKEWLKKSKGVTMGEPRTEIQIGLEFWFTPSAASTMAPTIQPLRYKMALIVTGIIFALTSTLLPEIRLLTADLPFVLSAFLGVAVMVLLMTYLIMPSVTRVLSPWLSRKGLL